MALDQVGRVLQVKMEVRFGAVALAAATPADLTAVHRVARRDPDLAADEAGVQRELSAYRDFTYSLMFSHRFSTESVPAVGAAMIRAARRLSLLASQILSPFLRYGIISFSDWSTCSTFGTKRCAR